MLESSNQGRTWFVREVRIATRRAAIGGSYDALRFASALVSVISRNPVHEESRENVAQLLRTALDAFCTAGAPDIVHLKSLYVFARDEGYPVKQEWLPSLPAADRGVAAALLNRPLGEQDAGADHVARIRRQPRGLPRRQHRDRDPVRFDLDQRRIQLSVGDFSDFSIGPQGSAGGAGGLWRAQLGTRWHGELQAQAVADGADADFEVPVEGEIARRGWIVALSGRIDQVVRSGGRTVLREIKTVSRPLPADEAELRGDYPGYFVQVAAYAALRGARESCELVFVETDTGLAQTVGLRPEDERLLDAQLDRIAEFLDLRLRARERLRDLRFRPAFAAPRHGQEEAAAELGGAVRNGQCAILLEAPDRVREDGGPARARAR